MSEWESDNDTPTFTLEGVAALDYALAHPNEFEIAFDSSLFEARARSEDQVEEVVKGTNET